MNGVSPGEATASSRERAPVTPLSSYASTGSAMPFTGSAPTGMTSIRPSTSRRVCAVSSAVPGRAICSIRAATCVACPTAV